MEADGEKVLQAIQRGITTRPRLRDSTGLTYAQLEIVLHGLEFEDQVINHTETADGFPRYSARAGGVMSVTEADQRSAAKKGVSLNGRKSLPSGAACGCGRPSNHSGRCAFRREQARNFLPREPPRQDSEDLRTASEIISDAEECLNVPAGALEEAVLSADIAVVEAIKEAPSVFPRDAFCQLNCNPETVGHHKDCSFFVVNVPREGDFRFPPSALLKKIVMDDDFFPGAYDTLVAILDADMSAEEKQAVWTLLQYLKRVEKTHQEACIAAEMAS